MKEPQVLYQYFETFKVPRSGVSVLEVLRQDLRPFQWNLRVLEIQNFVEMNILQFPSSFSSCSGLELGLQTGINMIGISVCYGDEKIVDRKGTSKENRNNKVYNTLVVVKDWFCTNLINTFITTTLTRNCQLQRVFEQLCLQRSFYQALEISLRLFPSCVLN